MGRAEEGRVSFPGSRRALSDDAQATLNRITVGPNFCSTVARRWLRNLLLGQGCTSTVQNTRSLRLREVPETQQTPVVGSDVSGCSVPPAQPSSFECPPLRPHVPDGFPFYEEAMPDLVSVFPSRPENRYEF